MTTAGTAVAALQVDDFDEFFRREFGGLVAVAYGLTGRRSLAEELAQEAMMVVHRRWDALRRYDDPAAFARRVVGNKAVSTFRRLVAEARALNRARPPGESTIEPVDEADERVWRAVRALPRRQAQAITLRYVAELDNDEIAVVLDTSVGNVRVLLHRARQALAEVLGAELEEDE